MLKKFLFSMNDKRCSLISFFAFLIFLSSIVLEINGYLEKYSSNFYATAMLGFLLSIYNFQVIKLSLDEINNCQYTTSYLKKISQIQNLMFGVEPIIRSIIAFVLLMLTFRTAGLQGFQETLMSIVFGILFYFIMISNNWFNAFYRVFKSKMEMVDKINVLSDKDEMNEEVNDESINKVSEIPYLKIVNIGIKIAFISTTAFLLFFPVLTNNDNASLFSVLQNLIIDVYIFSFIFLKDFMMRFTKNFINYVSSIPSAVDYFK